uniref:Uncharacterized protein n=1 Tax=Calcidiscus leptoporus TaxID=127549 RepID=A0A7S0JHM3_9EUKA
MAAMNTANGMCGLVWINGVNFKNLREAGNAYGPWADIVPNSVNFDFESTAIKYDKGVPTEGYEFPYNTAQSVFIWSGAPEAQPLSVNEIKRWLENEGKGKFAYANVTDFTGSLFVRTIFHALAGGAEVFTSPLTANAAMEARYMQKSPAVWQFLNDIKPYLYQDPATGGAIYPQTHAEVQQLMWSNLTLLDCAYDVNLAGRQIDLGNLPPHTVAYVLEGQPGTIANTNYVAIPINAQSRAASMAVGNFIGSLEAMFTRNEPEGWGALQSYNPKVPHIEGAGWNTAFNYLENHVSPAYPSVEKLAEFRLGELHSTYVERIEADWHTFVGFA